MVKALYYYYVIGVKEKMTTSDKLPPEETEEHRAESQRRLADLNNLLDKTRQEAERLAAIQKELFGAKGEKSREKSIWRGIVWFANADMHTEYRSYDAFREFLIYLIDPDFGTIENLEFQDIVKAQKTQDKESAFRRCVDQGQAVLRRLLLWLCDPNKHPELGRESIKLLFAVGNVIEGEWERNDRFDATGNDGEPFFFTKRVTQYGWLITPIFHFILQRIERYHEGEVELQEAIPVRRCEREGCGKFLVPARTDRKKFCSGKCLRLSHPPRSGEENRDYMRVYRLEHEPRSVLRKKLASAKWRTRLTEIAKIRPELSERVQNLKRRAGV